MCHFSFAWMLFTTCRHFLFSISCLFSFDPGVETFPLLHLLIFPFSFVIPLVQMTYSGSLSIIDIHFHDQSLGVSSFLLLRMSRGSFFCGFLLRALGPGFTVSFRPWGGPPCVFFFFFGENFSFFLIPVLIWLPQTLILPVFPFYVSV